MSTRYATLNGVSLDTPAWQVIDSGYDQLLNTPQLRGTDVVLPGAHGQRAYPRLLDATVVSFPLLIVGSVDTDGDPIADPFQGMFQHRDYLHDNLGLPGTSGVDADRGTVPLVFVRGGSLPNLTGEVTFLGLLDWVTIDGETGQAMARIDVSIPDGELVEAGS